MTDEQEKDEGNPVADAEGTAKNAPVLEPEEIDALMASMAPDEHAEALFASLPPMHQPQEVGPYDFASKDENGPARYPLFVNLQERFSEALKEHWDGLFQRDTEMKFHTMGQKKYQEIIAAETPQVYFAYEVSGYGRMMVGLDVALVVAQVDAMLGGGGEAFGDKSSQSLSPVEQRLAQRISKAVEKLLETVWMPIEELDFELYKLDTDSQFMSLAGSSDPCFFVSFESGFGHDLKGMVTLCYPRTFLEPLLDKLRSTVSDDVVEDDDEWQGQLEQALLDVPLELHLELGRCRINIGKFLQLKPGDFLPFSRNESDPSTLKVSKVALFKAMPGSQDGQLAAELIEEVMKGGAA